MALLTLMPTPWQTALDTNGNPIPNALIHFYVAGSVNTPLDTYSDSAGLVPNSNPVEADAAGRYVAYLLPTGYKVAMHDADDVLVRAQDNVLGLPPANVDVDVVAVAGEDIAANQGIYMATDGLWYVTDADDAAKSTIPAVVGVAPAAIATGETGTARRAGRVTGLSGLAAGSTYYFSGTAGAFTATPPANARVVGVADASGTSLILTIDAGGDAALLGNPLVHLRSSLLQFN